MKKVIILIMVLALVMCTGCSLGARDLQGKWVASNGENTIEFNKDDSVVIDGKYKGKYSVEDGRVSIQAEEAHVDITGIYKVKGDTLIIEVSADSTFYYFREGVIPSIINSNINKGFDTEEGIPYTPNFSEVNKNEAGYSKAERDINEKVVPLYKNAFPDSQVVINTSDMIELGGLRTYEVDVYVDEDIMGTYAVNTLILHKDKVDDVYKIWDGTLSLNHL